MSFEPLTTNMRRIHAPMLERCWDALNLTFCKTMDLEKFLLPEGSDQLQLWKEFRNITYDVTHPPRALNQNVSDTRLAKTVGWPKKHMEMFRTRNLVYPVILENLYSPAILHNLRTLPRRAQDRWFAAIRESVSGPLGLS